MSETNTNWQKVSLTLVGLLLGTGIAGGVGHYQYKDLTKKMNDEHAAIVQTAQEERDKLEERIQAQAETYQDLTTQMLVEVGRLGEKVDDLTAEVNRLRDKLER